MDVELLLQRLRAEGDGPTGKLATLVVRELLDQPLADVVEPERIASVVQDVAAEWLRSDRGEARLLQWWSEGADRVEQEQRTLIDLVPADIREAVGELAARPYSPDRAVLLRILDRPPVRKLLRDLMSDSLTAFGRKLSSGVGNTPLGALGRLGGSSSRRKPRSGLLGIAGAAASAVGSEVEKQVERRAGEFTDAGLSGALQRLVDLLADPSRASDQAALRLALLDGLWELSGPEVAAELRRGDTDAAAAVIRRTLTAYVDRDDFAATVAGALDAVLAEFGELDLRRALEDLELLASFEEHAVPVAREALERLFATEAFAAWFSELVAETAGSRGAPR